VTTTDQAYNTLNDNNILPKCLHKDKYNECVVNAELSAHNLARLARKDTPLLAHDSKASIKIQEMLNDKVAKYTDDATMKDLVALAGTDF